MKPQAPLTVALSAAVLLWAAAILTYTFGRHTGVTVAAFILGCVVAWIGILKHLDSNSATARKT